MLHCALEVPGPARDLEVRFEPLTAQQLDAVVSLEQQAYAHAWTRSHFQDALSAGYQAQMLLAGDT